MNAHRVVSRFYSSVGSDCKSGMVLAVNAPTTGEQTAAAFRAKALASTGSSGSDAQSTSGIPTQVTNEPTSHASSTLTAAPSVTSPPPPNDSQVPNAAAVHIVKTEIGLAAMVGIVSVTFAG